ncbi:MAG: hypothetical protein IKE56_02840 [Lachnospiraceae bacterium]|jgi:hypothetical protein|nr:hypothetical protein [Lachnospiraceae bacterium]
MEYDYRKLRQALQDEYMAAMVVGFTEDTPDLMELQYASDEWLLQEAQRRGFDMDEFVVEEEKEDGL